MVVVLVQGGGGGVPQFALLHTPALQHSPVLQDVVDTVTVRVAPLVHPVHPDVPVQVCF